MNPGHKSTTNGWNSIKQHSDINKKNKFLNFDAGDEVCVPLNNDQCTRTLGVGLKTRHT